MTKTKNKSNKKLLTFAICLIAMFQMPQLALSPAVNQIKTVVFSDYSLSAIQTAMALPSLTALAMSIITASLIRAGILRKKQVVMIGLLLLSSSGVTAILLHTEFWNLCLMGLLIGCGTGCYLSTMTSIMIDSYTQDELRVMTGVQSTFIQTGGILVSLIGGALISLIWYGGYLVMLIGLPLTLLAAFALPSYSSKDDSPKGGGLYKIPGWVFYYGAALLVFQLLYGVCGSNLSLHLAAAGIDDPKMTGYGTAISMAGGAACGLIFGKISRRLGDGMIALAYFVLFVGLTLVNLGQHYIAVVYAGTFLCGASFCCLAPQCVMAISTRVDKKTSAMPTAIISSIAPCIGGFLSPVIITNLTEAIAGDSTNFRYQFTAFVALALSVMYAVIVIVSKRRRVCAAE